MRNKPFQWSQEKLDRLKEIYSSYEKEEILKEFNGISWHALQEYARKRGVYRGYKSGHHKRKSWYRNGDLSPLLDNNTLTYYWIGYILADGWLSPQGQLVLVSSEKDKKQLDKFAKFIKSNNRPISAKHSGFRTKDQFQYRVAVQHKIVGKQIGEKFDIHHQKTYNPPNPDIYKNWSEELKLSILIGFIDGDGSLSSKYPRIEIHSKWIFFFQKLFDGDWASFNINKRGYLIIGIKIDTYQKMIDLIKKNKLPILKRKWSKGKIKI